MSLMRTLKKETAKAVFMFVSDKEKRKVMRKTLELKWGCADLSYYEVYFDGVFHKYNGLVATAANVKTLILGDSHAQFGCVPFLIGESAYNCAFNANSLYESFETLKKAAELCPELQTVVLFCSFYNGGYSLVRTTEAWRCKVLEKCLGIPFDFSVNKMMDFRPYDKIIAGLTPSTDKIYCQGFDFVGQHINRSTKKTRDRVLHHFKIYQKYNNQWGILRDFCDYCKQRGSRAVLVNPPVRSDYKAVLNEVGGRVSLIDDINDISTEKGVLLIDASDGFDDDDFADADHLNFNGAVKLTRRIMQAGKIH